ncbi:MAG: hypothetical protein HOP96_03125 [Sphingomonas sp.]|nr:hypothetical protein [Sphingomonas sp.]
MPRDETSHNAEFDEESSRLAEGLKTCQTVVNNYRAMMSANPVSVREPGNAQEAGDEPGGV